MRCLCVGMQVDMTASVSSISGSLVVCVRTAAVAGAGESISEVRQ